MVEPACDVAICGTKTRRRPRDGTIRHPTEFTTGCPNVHQRLRERFAAVQHRVSRVPEDRPCSQTSLMTCEATRASLQPLLLRGSVAQGPGSPQNHLQYPSPGMTVNGSHGNVCCLMKTKEKLNATLQALQCEGEVYRSFGCWK